MDRPAHGNGTAHRDHLHDGCTTLASAPRENEVLVPRVDSTRTDIIVETNKTVQVDACHPAQAVVEGDFTLHLWEWDFLLNGEQHRSGVHHAGAVAGIDVGSADEYVIEATGARLVVPLTPETYHAFLSNPRLDATSLHLTDAEGTLPGVLEPAQGDVELRGDYTASLASTGIQRPLTATLEGSTHTATVDGHVLALQASTPPSNTPLLLAMALGLALAALAWWRVRGNRQDNSERVHPVEAPTPLPQPSAQAQRHQAMDRDEEAEASVLTVVEADPGLVVRDLLGRARVSKERALRARDALLREGVLVQYGDGRRHLFVPMPGLEKRWRGIVALRDAEVRRLHAWLTQNPGADWARVLAVTAAWGWPQSTTRERLRRLVDAGLVERRGSSRLGTFSARGTGAGTLSARRALSGTFSA